MKKSRAATRTIDIMEVLANNPKGLSLTEIAALLEIPITSTSDIVNALLDKEIIEMMDKRSKIYGIGVNSYYIGNAFIANTNLIDKARDIVETLGDKLHKTVFLGKEINGKITYIYKYEPQGNLVSTCSIGSSACLHCTSLGKSILAHKNGLLEQLEGTKLQKKTQHTITDYDRLCLEINDVRKNGYAVDNREENEHLLCIGAPVFDINDDVIAAISISGLYNDNIDIEKESRIVKESALELSRKMGYSAFDVPYYIHDDIDSSKMC